MTDIHSPIGFNHEMAQKVSAMLKLIDHPERMLILCNLSAGEKCVSELVDLSYLSQSAFSQHLAILRAAGLVKVKRVGQTLYYSINNDLVVVLLLNLKELFCNEE